MTGAVWYQAKSLTRYSYTELSNRASRIRTLPDFAVLPAVTQAHMLNVADRLGLEYLGAASEWIRRESLLHSTIETAVREELQRDIRTNGSPYPFLLFDYRSINEQHSTTDTSPALTRSIGQHDKHLWRQAPNGELFEMTYAEVKNYSYDGAHTLVCLLYTSDAADE